MALGGAMDYCSVDRGDPGCLCNRWIILQVTCVEEACVLPMSTAAAFVIAGDDSKTFGTLPQVGSVRASDFGYAGVRSAYSYSRICISFVHLLFPGQNAQSTIATLSTVKKSTLLYSTNVAAVVCLIATGYRTAERQGAQRTPPDLLQICR